MAFKLKSALKFGQKTPFKAKVYNSPNKQKQQKSDSPKLPSHQKSGFGEMINSKKYQCILIFQKLVQVD